MFKNVFIILILFCAYIYIVSTDHDKVIPKKIAACYQDMVDYLDDLDIELHVNKWPVRKK
jgi:hypothetical protein